MNPKEAAQARAKGAVETIIDAGRAEADVQQAGAELEAAELEAAEAAGRLVAAIDRLLVVAARAPGDDSDGQGGDLAAMVTLRAQVAADYDLGED